MALLCCSVVVRACKLAPPNSQSKGKGSYSLLEFSSLARRLCVALCGLFFPKTSERQAWTSGQKETSSGAAFVQVFVPTKQRKRQNFG